MQSKATTVAAYLEGLPADRRVAIEALRETILANLDRDYEEGVQYGMIGYYVPHSVYPPGYHCDPKQPLPFASIASQKNHLAFYCMGVYMDPELVQWFVEAWKKTGKKLDMGKSCIRFKRIEDVPLEVIGEVVRRLPAARYIAKYDSDPHVQKARGAGAKKPGASGAAKAKDSGNASGSARETSAGKISAGKPSAAKSSTAKAAGPKTATKKTGSKMTASKSPVTARSTKQTKR